MKFIKLTSALLLLTLFTSCGFHSVDTGSVGVKRNFGKIVETDLQPGLHFYTPILYSISEVEVTVQKVEGRMTEARGAMSKDNQNVALEYVLNFNYEAAEASFILTQGNKHYAAKVLPQIVEASIRQTIGQYNAEDLAQKLGEVTLKVSDKISKANIRGINLGNIELTNIDFSDEFEKAVEAKVVATQKAQQTVNETVQVREKAKQRVYEAKADAEALTETAKAQAEAMRIKSKALTENKSLVEYEAVQRWDGRLPQYILGGGVTPFIQLDKLGRGE